jgi:hypothetical protein
MKALQALIVLPLLALGGTAQAHHSFAMFDQTKTVTLNGTVAEFQWTNPHAWIEIMVPDQTGKPVKWSVELNSPNNLTRQGFKRTSLKPGDKAVVVINPLRDGKKGGLFNRVTLPDGKVLGEKTITGRPINVPTSAQ